MSENPDIHPTDEDLSVGTPDMGIHSLVSRACATRSQG